MKACCLILLAVLMPTSCSSYPRATVYDDNEPIRIVVKHKAYRMQHSIWYFTIDPKASATLPEIPAKFITLRAGSKNLDPAQAHVRPVEGTIRLTPTRLEIDLIEPVIMDRTQEINRVPLIINGRILR